MDSTNDLRDVSVTQTYKVRVSGSLAIGGFKTRSAAYQHFLARGYLPAQLSITPETRLVLR